MEQVKQPLGKVAFEAAEPVEKKQAKQPANRNLRKLVRDMEAAWDEMAAIVKKYS